jgi:hypothetical protein
MARLKSIPEVCSRPDCMKRGRARIYCESHFKTWLRRYGGDRCDWPECEEIIATDAWDQPRRKDGTLLKVDGRTMDTGSGRLALCRRHEVEHLRPSASIEKLNRDRLGADLEVKGECWVPKVSRPSLNNNAATFDPEGSNGKVHWPYHRAVWDLLMGGHGQRRELDHLTGCAVQARCANPAHVEPVTRIENVARRAGRNAARKAGKPYGRKTCGPPINWDAAEAPAVVAFAREYGLPLPRL